LIAAGSFYYEYKNGFNESIPITTACVIVYWFIQSVSFVYNFFVEKEEVFVGTKEKVKEKKTSN
jgi:signal peptidase complex subunit 2